MKIAAIFSQEQLVDAAKEALTKTYHDDHFIFLQRKDSELGIDRLDLYSTNILILDFDRYDAADLKVIAECTSKNSNPAVILMTNDNSEGRLIEYMRAGVSEVISLPLDPKDLTDAIERLRKKRYISSTYHPRGKILSFISAKGSAGATFIGGNLAYLLATEHNLQVLYVDLNLQFGDASFYFSDSISGPSIADIAAQTGLDSTIIATTAIKINKNFNLIQAPDSPDKAGSIRPHHVDSLITVAIQDYDYVIVDLPRTIDATALKVLDRCDKINLVFQPEIPYIRAASKFLDLFNQLDYTENKVDLILNRMERRHSISESKIEDTLQTKIAWVIPSDFINCMESTNTGMPVYKHNPNCEVSRCLASMSDVIVNGGAEKSRSSRWNNLFGLLGSRT